jgi:hypothetical protein
MDEKFLGLLGEKVGCCHGAKICLLSCHIVIHKKNLLGKSFDVDGKSIF